MSSWSYTRRIVALAISFIAVGFVMDALGVHSNVARVLYLGMFLIGMGMVARRQSE